jgi:hypothetical protein
MSTVPCEAHVCIVHGFLSASFTLLRSGLLETFQWKPPGAAKCLAARQTPVTSLAASPDGR